MKRLIVSLLSVLLILGSSQSLTGGALESNRAPENLVNPATNWWPQSVQSNAQLVELSQYLKLQSGIETSGLITADTNSAITAESTAAPSAEATSEPTAEATSEPTADAPATTATETAAAQAPTAQQLEDEYDAVWQIVAFSYYNPDALTNWGSWRHKFDGQLTTVPELETALQEMVASIGDHWTSYTPRTDLLASWQSHQAGYVDLGLTLQLQNGAYRVFYVQYGSAAWLADFRRGDIITEIGGTRVTNKTTEAEVEAMLSRQAGSKVTIAYQHGTTTERTTLTAIEAPADEVVSHLDTNGIAYIRLPNFEDTQLLQDFFTQLRALYDDSAPQHFKAIALDLRGNPGGRLDEALDFVSVFLPDGVALNETTRSGRMLTTSQLFLEPSTIAGYKPSEFAAYLQRVPMFVLIDGTTASAAEVTTGALKDNERAIIIGTTTFGKGVGYVRFDQNSGPYQVRPAGGLLQITTLSYRTPDGDEVQGYGIHPDIAIQQPRAHTTDTQLEQALRYINAHA
ncbi:MAG: PDZ domain-containing protein [Cyanobacteria bacterium SZAS-4]|nr:PDZ domain-containing protein [Cyanobacteria bacterium SZAS-4]